MTQGIGSPLDQPIVLSFFRDEAASTIQVERAPLREMIPTILEMARPLKTDLPWLKLARFGNKRTERQSLRHDANVVAISGIEADYDLEQMTLEEARSRLEQADLAALVYTSPSYRPGHHRWRVLCPTSTELPPAMRAPLLARLNGVLGGVLARESFTLSQAYYLGHLTGASEFHAFAVEGRAIDLAADLDAAAIGRPKLASETGQTPAAPRATGERISDKYLETALMKECGFVANAPEGQRNEQLNRSAFSLGTLVGAGVLDKATVEAELTAAAAQAGLNGAEVLKTLRSGLVAGIANPRKLPEREQSTPAGPVKMGKGVRRPLDHDEDGVFPDPSDEAEPAADTWDDLLLRTDNGKAQPNLANVLVLLRNEPLLRDCFAFDEMVRTVVVRRPPPGVARDGFPRPIRDTDVTAVQEWVQRAALPRIGSDVVHAAIDLRALDNSFHPIKDYLNGITWDGVPRLDTWLHTYLGVEHGSYASGIGRMFLIASVARIMRPGCKADYMLVFEGTQGAGKSTACQILGGDYYSDSLPDIRSGKDVSQHLNGKWFIELAELSGLDKVEAAALKAFITRTEEKYRPSYGRREVTEKRQCVFTGTTNKAAYLRDETGARRFWPVTVGAIDTEALKRDRDQLLAEALAAFQAGEKWWPDRDFEQRHIQPQQEARFEADVWESRISEFLQHRQRVLVSDVAVDGLGMEMGRIGTADSRRIMSAMERLGWERGPRFGPSGSRSWVKQ